MRSHTFLGGGANGSILIGSGAVLATVVSFQPETYSPVLLKWKAKHLCQLTKDNRYVSSVEIRGESFSQRLVQALCCPFLLTAREPIIMLFGLYLTVVFIISFTFLNGFTFILLIQAMARYQRTLLPRYCCRPLPFDSLGLVYSHAIPPLPPCRRTKRRGRREAGHDEASAIGLSLVFYTWRPCCSSPAIFVGMDGPAFNQYLVSTSSYRTFWIRHSMHFYQFLSVSD